MKSDNEIIRDIKDEAFIKILKTNNKLMMKGIKKLKSQADLETRRKGELLKNNLSLLEENQVLKKQNKALLRGFNKVCEDKEELKKQLDDKLNEDFEKHDMTMLKLITKNKELEKQLQETRYLDREEVKKQFDRFSYYFPKHGSKGVYEIETKGLKNFINQICSLALPTQYIVDGDKRTITPVEKVTRERITKELEHEKENLSGVIAEIIHRCFINYESLPKAEDIVGILGDDKNGQ